MGFFKVDPALQQQEEERKRERERTGCDACGLDRSGKDSQFVGEGKDRVLILADFPRGGEDNSWDNALSCSLYSRLWDLQGKRGIPRDIMSHAWVGYAVPCPCSRSKSPAPDCCKERLDRLIQELKPRVIIPMGPLATQALVWDRMSGRIRNTQPSDLFGKTIPDRKYNCWICPTYGMEFLSWQRDDHCPAAYFAQHLRAAWALKDRPLPVLPTDIRTTEDPVMAAGWLQDIIGMGERGELGRAPDGTLDVAIDYETTGLKPHRDGHGIRAASVAYRLNGEYHAIGFWWDAHSRPLVDTWYRLTHHRDIGLVAHKADFEACWTRFRAGMDNGRTDWPTNWSWDTCLGAHVIDNNQKTGLKLHTYCELGVIGYDTKADDYISKIREGEDKDSKNAFNLLKDTAGVPKADIVYYCAQDSLYTLPIRDSQAVQMQGLERPFRFFMQGMDTLARVQSEGLPIDMSKVDALKADLTSRYEGALAGVMALPEVKKWESMHPGERFNPGSTKQLKDLLYTQCKLKAPQGVEDTREETLEKLGTPVCKGVLEMRRWAKIRDTFLASYTREAVWDEETQCHLIRPFFNLATGAGSEGNAGPRTYRSSADSPNFQNIPKRDKEMKKMLRNLFVAPPGYRYMEMDYKSLEVMVSASYHHDPQMIHYLQNPDSDMHRDTACDMYIRSHEELTKEERSTIKSGYVFSSFYGASYRSCAAKMWADMPAYTKKHLMEDCGIKTYQKWEEHVRKADDIFWNKRFRVYNAWRRKEWKRYQDYGYVQSYTGFRCWGPMGYTEATNRCIQGSAFHILLQALIWDAAEIMGRKGMKSRLIGQIHDAIIALVADGEEDMVASTVYRNGVERVSRQFPWICVPLVIEAEASELGGAWAHMTDVGALDPGGIADRDWRKKFNG
jgi:DNA polymerase I-like protein with 3'-5' exonuclease and polymerase domains